MKKANSKDLSKNSGSKVIISPKIYVRQLFKLIRYSYRGLCQSNFIQIHAMWALGSESICKCRVEHNWRLPAAPTGVQRIRIWQLVHLHMHSNSDTVESSTVSSLLVHATESSDHEVK